VRSCADTGFFPWQRATLRLADEQVDVFRHDHVAADEEAVGAANLFKGFLDEGSRLRRCEAWATVITTEGDEMEVARLLVPLQSFRHGTGVSVLCFMDRDLRHGSHPVIQLQDDKGGAPKDSSSHTISDSEFRSHPIVQNRDDKGGAPGFSSQLAFLDVLPAHHLEAS
jgi:hypothetical protein